MSADGTPPQVSIVIPVFNAGQYLDQALRSVVAQTYRDFEVVMVDDGSTDARTVVLLDEWARRPGIVFHRTPNRGPANARNLAVESARGTYVLALDADDYLAPTFLERTVRVLDAESKVGVVHTWVGLVGHHHGVWRTGGFTLPELLSRCTIHVSSLYRRRIWGEVGGYDPRFVESCEDWDFWIGAAAKGWLGECVPEVLAYYRRTPSSRELNARAPDASARLMRTLVTKHRALYETHLEAAMAGMYQRLSAAGVTLERIYHHPALRMLLWVRGLVQRA